jgi:3-oxoacyl-[acyl-carrier protein] reductase
MTLDNKICVVTGASEGIGRATAHALGAAGGAIAICARGKEGVETTLASLSDAGVKAVGTTCDVSNESDVAAFAEFVKDSLGPADILINNAGIGILAPLAELTLEQIDATFAVNVRGVFLVTKAFLPGMIERRDCDIVNIASLAGKNAFVGGTAYSASKHAVMGMSKSLMLEVRQYGIRVVTICPGSVDTPFFDKAGWDPGDRSKILTADAVAESVVDCLRLPRGAMISDLDIRPANP